MVGKFQKTLGMVVSVAALFSCTNCAEVDEGCVVEGAAEISDEVTFRSVNDNGEVLNGTEFNGTKLNGTKLNGTKLNGIALNIASMLGIEVTGFTLQGSLLQAVKGGVTLSGAALTDTTAEFSITPEGGGPDVIETLKIGTVTQSALQPDVYFTKVYRKAGSGPWESLCKDGAGAETEAIAIQNDWLPTTGARKAISDAVTWACRGAALAKCIEWGYRPWATVGGDSLEEFHQACTRMVRADYCGDGVTHTTNGNAIDVSDIKGIQTPDTTWAIEAKWGPDGAVCLSTPRKLFWPRASIPCAASLPLCTNSNPAEFGGLLMTRSVPNNNP